MDELIYDIGMHVGNDSAFYLACGYRVIAIEANPALVQSCRERFVSEVKSGRLIILNVAIADKAGDLEFWVNESRSGLSSFSKERVCRFGEPHHSTMVAAERLDALVTKYGVPLYMKIDIEGHDMICLEQLSSSMAPKYISVEMSDSLLLLRLRDLGYTKFKLISQYDLQPVSPIDLPFRERVQRSLYRASNRLPSDRTLHSRVFRWVSSKTLSIGGYLNVFRPARPFRSALVPNWEFETLGTGNHSGSFGAELPGRWLGWEEALTNWNLESDEYEKMGQDIACDLHANF